MALASTPHIQEYTVLGMMSGTSLDGLDLTYCRFSVQDGAYHFQIVQAETIPYPAFWQQRLQQLTELSGLELTQTHTELGRYMGEQAKKFIDRHKLQPELIASHGHTVFHQPHKGFTLQIGDGYQLMLATGCRVVNDFRSLDVALGGQGAPLVPIGDELLFGEYDFCLNIGGIANISATEGPRRIAYDICPANMILNLLAKREGLSYDSGGQLARKGLIEPELLHKLDALEYYHQPFPKSLGYEWVSENIFPLINSFSTSTENLLHTFCQHIARQLRNSLQAYAKPTKQRMLATGGGAYNTFLIELMQKELNPLGIEVIVPDKQLIEYKEALVFALLGVLRIRQEVNSLSSVTGASRNSCGGLLYENI